jgi:hypothetical protein
MVEPRPAGITDGFAAKLSGNQTYRATQYGLDRGTIRPAFYKRSPGGKCPPVPHLPDPV